MKEILNRRRTRAVLALAIAVLLGGWVLAGIPNNGAPGNGLPGNGIPDNGLPGNGLPGNGLPGNGVPGNGLPGNGLPGNGLPGNGLPGNGLPRMGHHHHWVGPLGLAPGQAARLSIADFEEPPVPPPNTPGAAGGVPPGPPDDVQFYLFSGDGKFLGSSTDTLGAGQTKFLEVTYGKLVNGGIVAPDLTGRIEMFGIIVCGEHPQGSMMPHIASLEVLDLDAGATTARVESGAIRGVVAPDRPSHSFFGTVGLAQGQTARLTVTQMPPGTQFLASPGPTQAPAGTPGEQAPGPPNFPPGPPQLVELSFYDDLGNEVLKSEATLTPGHGASLDWSSKWLPQGAARGQIRASFKVLGVAKDADPALAKFPSGPCRGTLEIFDSATGKSGNAFLPAVQRALQLTGN